MLRAAAPFKSQLDMLAYVYMYMDHSPTLLALADALDRIPLQGNSKTICFLRLDSANEKLAAVQCLFDYTATDAIINNATSMPVAIGQFGQLVL